ncbi:MAG TPA: hypothetical protein VGW35_08750 [Methylomirabilota bacterium]|nr:hypothetical protein [Methylomirabilota bacterium]
MEERKFHEVAKYMLFPTYYDVRSSLLMNRAAFEKLPADLQNLLVETVREVEEWGAKVFREEAERERDRLRKQGVEPVTLPDAEARQFLKIAPETLWEQIVKDSPRHGPRLREVFTRAAQLG